MDFNKLIETKKGQEILDNLKKCENSHKILGNALENYKKMKIFDGFSDYEVGVYCEVLKFYVDNFER